MTVYVGMLIRLLDAIGWALFGFVVADTAWRFLQHEPYTYTTIIIRGVSLGFVFGWTVRNHRVTMM